VRLVVVAAAVVLALAVAGVPMPSVPFVSAGAEPGAPSPAPAAVDVPASVTPSVPAPVPSPTPGGSGTFVLLQMNLCNSGMALLCYSSGRAVDEAAARIRQYSPDVVTLQEVCRDDLYSPTGWGKLAQAMAHLDGGAQVKVNFVPARNLHTDEPYRCVNGEQFGVALIHRGDGEDHRNGRYRSQDPSPEARVWGCSTVLQGRLTACTTHQSTKPDVGMRQCRELIATLGSPWAMPQVVLAGDLNLRSLPGDKYDVRKCAPNSYVNKNDNWLQQVFFSRTMPWVEGRFEKMRWTDHPMLYQRFHLPGNGVTP
jgi:endonuclease/exonuclease/phosphatase family metal-dependent hydrolase